MNYELCCSRSNKNVLLKFLGKMQATTAKLLQRCLLPEIRRSPDDHFVSQQDGAPSHRAKSTVKFLQRTVPNFVVWPLNLNLVDYAVWGALQQSVYRIPVSNLDVLEARGQSAHLLGESWPIDHQQVHWWVAWQTEGSSSSEWWTHDTLSSCFEYLHHLMSCSVV